MGSERAGGKEYTDKTREAACICGASQAASTVAKTAESVNRKRKIILQRK